MERSGTQHYDAVVIGSGFGGTMTALPLAQEFKRRGQGEKTLILERGTWWTTPVGTVQDKELKTYDFLVGKDQPTQFWSSAEHFRGFIDIFTRCRRYAKEPGRALRPDQLRQARPLRSWPEPKRRCFDPPRLRRRRRLARLRQRHHSATRSCLRRRALATQLGSGDPQRLLRPRPRRDWIRRPLRPPPTRRRQGSEPGLPAGAAEGQHRALEHRHPLDSPRPALEGETRSQQQARDQADRPGPLDADRQ